MAFLLGIVLAISIVPASSNVIKRWDPRLASLTSSENARVQARGLPDTNVVFNAVAPSHNLLDHIEETTSTGSEQASLEPQDPATVTLSLGGIRTLMNDDSNPPPPSITAVSDKASVVDLSPQSEQKGTKHTHLASTLIKTHGALPQPTDNEADRESSALPTSPPKGAIVPPPPVLGTGGERTLDPLELRAVAPNPIPTNHPTLVTIHAATNGEAAIPVPTNHPTLVTIHAATKREAAIPVPTNHPTLVTIHAATNGEAAIPIPTNHPSLVTIHAATNGEAAIPIPTNHPSLVTIHAATNGETLPTLATVYASHGASGIPITAQRQVYTTYSSMTTCEYSPSTTVPFIATAPPPPLQAQCQTHLSPIVTSYCSTTIPQLAAANITVTNCNQQITYATSNGYSIIFPTGNAQRNAPAIQTLMTYSAAVWDALTPGATPTAGERVVCTQGGGCSSTRFFKGAAATNGSTATNPPYALANSTGGPLYGLGNSTATAGHFTIPAPFARGTGSHTVPPFPIVTATGSSSAKAANSTAPTFQWLNSAPTTTPQAREAATSAPLVGQQPDAGDAGDFWGVPAPVTIITDTLRPTTSAPATTTSSVIDIGF